MFNYKRLVYFALAIILLFGFWLRYKNVEGNNLVFDFDQYEDAFYTYKIVVDRDPVIIGRAIYGDPRIHHGVFFFYYNALPFFFSGGNPFASVYWNSVFNLSSALILFFLAKSIFKKNLPSLAVALIAAVSAETIKFTGWLTNETPAVFVVPLFYFSLWSYLKGKKWALVLAAISLGLSIQTALTFIYLIPIVVIFWIIFRPKFPDFKLLSLAVFALITSILTMILTEIKLNFAGVKTLLNLSASLDEARLSYIDRLTMFSQDFGKQFSLNLFPQMQDLGNILALVIILAAVSPLIFKKNAKEDKQGILFICLYLFSPLIALFIGYHQKPWSLIALPGAIALISGYAISRLKSTYLIFPALAIIVFSNSKLIMTRPSKAYENFDNIYDQTSYLKYQLQLVDYTYQQADGQPFAINAVTYPLYYNGMWAYIYNWYGKSRYGYTPSWLGGDQLHPYDLLTKSDKNEKNIFMIISNTTRIPEVYKGLGKLWANQQGPVVREKTFDGFIVLEVKNEKP